MALEIFTVKDSATDKDASFALCDESMRSGPGGEVPSNRAISVSALTSFSIGASAGLVLEGINKTVDKNVSLAPASQHNVFQKKWADARPHVLLPQLSENFLAAREGVSSAVENVYKDTKALLPLSSKYSELRGSIARESWMMDVVDHEKSIGSRLAFLDQWTRDGYRADHLSKVVGTRAEVHAGEKLFVHTSPDVAVLKDMANSRALVRSSQAALDEAIVNASHHEAAYRNHRRLYPDYITPSNGDAALKGALLGVAGALTGLAIDRCLGKTFGYEPAHHSALKVMLDAGSTSAIVGSSLSWRYKAPLLAGAFAAARFAAWAGY